MSVPAFELDLHLALEPLGSGSFGAELVPGWVVGGGINGGLLLALAGKAAGAVLDGKANPIAVSAHYVSPAAPGPAVVTARVRREGRSLGTVAVDVEQEGQLRLTALVTAGSLAPGEEAERVTAVPPDLPPTEKCVPASMGPPELLEIVPMLGRFDLLLHPDHVGWATGAPSGRGLLSAWYRLVDGREPDPVSLLQVVDALPPVTFDIGIPGWAPTLELTAHVRAAPAPGWLRVTHTTRYLAGGMFEEDCEVWDSADRLVAQSRQLARRPRG
ncbi:thioesterase family protein [Frankia sp. CNm7]|uniref:Thioesterase family protein n=1 Tax=Frankia nepalensis TaxID=1836974 RepID=A0A937URD2_9ACTN|nr:thioesterase family protein [Frankia nepalensis]MBL7500476.1 thioesterase family protein [Frankia nepalensis]MBL7512828.1 thioesterase family protein [Frankia nepalensis]MBL7522525.1 thioesterase family protein [Frankia nepalensis]MBL7631232.1 thioesterase family protein [Frankia nepalensis]